MKDIKKKKVIIILLAVIGIILIGLATCVLSMKKTEMEANDNSNSNTQDDKNNLINNNDNSHSVIDNNKEYENTFVYDVNGSYGIAYAQGYAKVKKEYYCETIPVAECNENNADSVEDVVYFYVVNTESEDLKKEINESFGEQHRDKKSFQLGCVKDGIISFYAIADAFYNSSNTGIDDEHKTDNYWKKISLSKEDTQKIISSNEREQITLKLEKLKYTHDGSDGVICVSRMTGINVVD